MALKVWVGAGAGAGTGAGAQRRRFGRDPWLWSACLAFAASEGWAQPAPVKAGIWDVRSLVTFEPVPKAAGQGQPAAQARSYRICIGPERARSPMLPRDLPPAAELVFDGQSYTGSFDDADDSRRQVDISYRRLSATAFEGWHDAKGRGLIARTQFFAQYGGPNCGATPPGWPSDSGLP